MELLAEQDRKVVVMREWQGLPFAQIAEELGGNEESARGAYRRAVERLRARMAELRTGGLPAALAAAEAERDESAAG
jgi:DNA-directed RNA polymerase specialized sigma24 family protein